MATRATLERTIRLKLEEAFRIQGKYDEGSAAMGAGWAQMEPRNATSMLEYLAAAVRRFIDAEKKADDEDDEDVEVVSQNVELSDEAERVLTNLMLELALTRSEVVSEALIFLGRAHDMRRDLEPV